MEFSKELPLPDPGPVTLPTLVLARWGELWPGAVGPAGQGTEGAGGCFGMIRTRAGSSAANPLRGSPRGSIVAPRSQPCQ